MEIKRYHWNSDEADALIKAGQPVVLLQCPLAYPAYRKWTMDNLKRAIGNTFQCDVFVSTSNRFTYWDDNKNTSDYSFDHPTEKITMTFQEYCRKHMQPEPSKGVSGNSKKKKSLKKAAAASTASPPVGQPHTDGKYYYLQQGLVAEMGGTILEEYSSFSLETALRFKQLGKWDALTNNLLLCGKRGTVTPCHFDEQENLFAQLHGRKRVRLFSPDDWDKLYPYPYGHPCDRQAQVGLRPTPGDTTYKDHDERLLFPAFERLAGRELFVDLEPGEIVYIPQYWFHQMEALTDNISLSWWFVHSSNRSIDFSDIDINEISLVAMRRNLEKLIASMIDTSGFGGKRNIHNFFLAVASGRISVPPYDAKIFALSEDSLLQDKPSSGRSKAIKNGTTTAVVSKAAGADSSAQLEGKKGPETARESTSLKLSASSSSSSSSSSAGGSGSGSNGSCVSVGSSVGSPHSSALTTSAISTGSRVSNSTAPSPTLLHHAKENGLVFNDSDSPLAVDVVAAITKISDAEMAANVPQWLGVVHKALEFISYILKPEQARGFLRQLVAGRFNAF